LCDAATDNAPRAAQCRSAPTLPVGIRVRATEMVVNLTIAKALGLAVPPSILLRAAGDRLKMCAPSPGPNDGVADSIAGARDEALTRAEIEVLPADKRKGEGVLTNLRSGRTAIDGSVTRRVE